MKCWKETVIDELHRISYDYIGSGSDDIGIMYYDISSIAEAVKRALTEEVEEMNNE